MSQKYPGGLIRKTPPTVVGPVDGEGGSAPGLWTLTQALELNKQNLWPKPLIQGALWAWGQNTVGTLGLGDAVNRSSPVQVGSSAWAKINSGGSSTFAFTADGSLWRGALIFMVGWGWGMLLIDQALCK